MLLIVLDYPQMIKTSKLDAGVKFCGPYNSQAKSKYATAKSMQHQPRRLQNGQSIGRIVLGQLAELKYHTTCRHEKKRKLIEQRRLGRA